MVKLWFTVEHKRSPDFSGEVGVKIVMTTLCRGCVLLMTGRGITVWLNCGSQLSTNEAQTFPVKFASEFIVQFSTVIFRSYEG